MCNEQIEGDNWRITGSGKLICYDAKQVCWKKLNGIQGTQP